MQAKVKVTRDGLNKLLSRVEALTRSEVLVGIPAGPPRDDALAQGITVTNAEIGYLNEFGSPAMNIPARPFLIPGVTDARDKVAAALLAGARAALSDNPGPADASLMRAGIVAQTSVQLRITEGPFVPLAPATIAKRREQGHAGTKPLLMSGMLRRSVQFVVRPKGG